MRVVIALSAVLACATASQDGDPRLHQIAARDKSSVAAVEVYGNSGQGRPLSVLRLGSGNKLDRDAAPALLIVAGLDGRDAAAVDCAYGLADALATQHADALRDTTVYIIPAANPDALARWSEAGPKPDFGGVLLRNGQDDLDGDGRANEDPPADMNGDGFVTMMRVSDPPPGIPRTHLADPEHPRLMRPAERARGERPTHALLPESTDLDGDGAFGENGPGGVDLNRNFPHRWPEHQAGAGAVQLCAQESRSLVEWMLERPDIAAVLVLGQHETVVNVPPTGKTDATKQAPLGIEDDDKAYHEEISRVFKDITGRKKSSKDAGPGALDDAGAFFAWCYAQFGVPTFATPVYLPSSMRDEGDEPDENDKSDDNDQPDDPENGKPPTKDKTKDKTKDTDARKRGGAESWDLTWLEEADRRGEGFVAWTPFDHPVLGAVEIGGFVPGFRHSAPGEGAATRVEQQTDFVLALLARLPRISTPRVAVDPLGHDVWRVRVSVTNDGTFPTMSAIGVKVRRLLPTVFRLEADDATLLSGDRVQRTWTVEGGGGEAAAEWIVAGAEGDTLPVTLRSRSHEPNTIGVTLRADQPREGGR